MSWTPDRLTREQMAERRAQGARLLAEGKLKHAAIARELGVHPSAVSLWAKMLRERGPGALARRKPPGRASRLDASCWQRLLTDLAEGAERWGYPNEQWTLPRVAAVLHETQGESYHPDSLSRILGKLGWSSQRPQRRARERDERAIGEWVSETFPEVRKSG